MQTKDALKNEDIPALVQGARVATADGRLDAFMEEVFGKRDESGPYGMADNPVTKESR